MAIEQLELISDVKTLVQLLRWRAEKQPFQTAYTFLLDGESNEVNLTYAQLDQRARTIAAYLQSLISPRERVLLLYPSGLDYITAFFGCLYANMIAVPAYPPRVNRSLSRIQGIVANSQAKVVLASDSTWLSVKQQLSSLLDLHWVLTDTLANNAIEEWQEPKIEPEELAFLQYTSGSTGMPKGVMITHGNLIHNLQIIYQAFELTETSKYVSWLPLYHDMGLIGGVLQPLYAGCPIVLMSPFSFLQKPIRWLKAISRYQATTSGAPNFAYDLCVRKITPEQRETLNLSSWDVAVMGAEPIQSDTLEQFATTFSSCGFRKEAFYPCYGLAEATLFVSGAKKADFPVVRCFRGEKQTQNPRRNLVSCGHSWLDQKIVIVNPKTLQACESGQEGEIWVFGSSIAKGYWEQPIATELTFQVYLPSTGEGPFLRTGDLGLFCDGELFVTGRLKDLIIVDGRNHYPQDIEITVEKSHPSIRPNSSAAFSLEIGGAEKLVVVAEVERRFFNLHLQNTQPLSVETVIKAICDAITQQNDLPVFAVSLLKPGSIPKTSSGKIQRYACRSRFLKGELDCVASWSSIECPNPFESQRYWLTKESSTQTLKLRELEHANPTHQQELLRNYVQIQIAKLVGLTSFETLNPEQPLDELGLDSLMLLELKNRLSRDLNINVPIEELLQYTNASTLATKIAQKLTDEHVIRQNDVSNFPAFTIYEEQSSSNTGNDAEVSLLTSELLVGQQVEDIPPSRGFLTRFVLTIFGFISRLIWKFEVTGVENVPSTGSFILCPNHESHFDGLWVISCLAPSLKYQFCALAKKEHFETPLNRFFASLAGAIPTDREGDALPALRNAAKVLLAHRPLLVHPEGTRTRTGAMLPFRRGVATLAIATGSPLVPVRIIGAYEIFPPSKPIPHLFNWRLFRRYTLRIVFGSPISPPQEKGLAAEIKLIKKLRESVELLGSYKN